MSRTRIVKGTYNKITEGNHNIYSEGNIISSASNGKVTQTGVEKGVSHNEPEKYNSMIDKSIVDGWWSDLKNNKINEALFGQTVRFHIKTTGFTDGELLSLQFYKENFLKDIRVGSIKSAQIKNNEIVFDFHLRKEWKSMLDDGSDNPPQVKIYCETKYSGGKSQDIGKFLTVSNKDKVVVFFIGGAADKESYYFQGPNHNIKEAKDTFESMKIKQNANSAYYSSYYLDYSDAYNDDKMRLSIYDNLNDNTVSIYIVGHSLGAWNGAHLSQILSDEGYHVEMLITLDPVGEGIIVFIGSAIYRTEATPKCNLWIDILATPTKPDDSDGVAKFGERWKDAVEKANIGIKMDIHHWNAEGMLLNKFPGQSKSAADYLYESINSKLQQ